jgi:hypothetical protein
MLGKGKSNLKKSFKTAKSPDSTDLRRGTIGAALEVKRIFTIVWGPRENASSSSDLHASLR